MNTAVGLFVVAVIPLMAYIAERLVKFSVSKGLEKNKIFSSFIAVVVIVPITLLTFFIVNDYREKGLTDVIRVNASHVTTLELDGGSTDGWRTDEKEKVEQ
ncbi:hypothetical protein [Sporosarcina sp. FSL K6-2383]|uniref:hypothetical protein n=1 Tax=Sporosarcina sp. FSL K6-2383 TaxID=2921556 RepID=UPI00315AF486